MEEAVVLFQGTLNPGKSRFSTPYDSTQGAEFYWFAFFFLLFIVLGVLKDFGMIPPGVSELLRAVG
ncbi:MAG: hypothetical protein KF763_07520 [Cyclobacteriaceae bacterium]|nr:hypothetical protein [Cyclobacteriaceae bacterium]